MGQATQNSGLCLLPSSCPHIPHVLWWLLLCNPHPSGHKALTLLLPLIRAPLSPKGTWDSPAQ